MIASWNGRPFMTHEKKESHALVKHKKLDIKSQSYEIKSINYGISQNYKKKSQNYDVIIMR